MSTIDRLASPLAGDDALDPEDWAVVHDFLMVNGGAEAVTRRFCTDVLPGSPLWYLAGNEAIAAAITDGDRRQVLGPAVTGRNYRALAPMIPMMLKTLTPTRQNLLVSSYAFAAGVPTLGRKVVYCHSPLRQAWSGAAAYTKQGPLLERLGTRLLGPYFRRTDLAAAVTADVLVATSRAVQARIERFYQREARVVPPPVDEATFYFDDEVERDDVFIWAGRITEPYKRLGVVLDAFRAMPRARLLVVGEGRDRQRLERDASPNVTFLGWRNRQQLGDLFRRSAALIFPSEDDFGLVPVEAMACGLPVLAYARGGALDTVANGRTGIHFDEQSADAVRDAVRQFTRTSWDRPAIAERALEGWGRARFTQAIRETMLEAVR